MCLPAAAAAGGAAAAGAAAASSIPISTLLYSSLAITALQTGLSIIGASQQASAQADYAKRVAEASVKDYLNRTAAEGTRVIQEQEAAAQAVQQNQIEALKKKATARVAAGEAGVAGLSVDALIADYSRSEAAYREAVKRNLDYEILASQDLLKAYRAEAQGRIAYTPPIERPDYIGALLRGGGEAFGTYMNFAQYDTATRKYRI